jgi:hypothetical protein
VLPPNVVSDRAEIEPEPGRLKALTNIVRTVADFHDVVGLLGEHRTFDRGRRREVLGEEQTAALRHTQQAYEFATPRAVDQLDSIDPVARPAARALRALQSCPEHIRDPFRGYLP